MNRPKMFLGVLLVAVVATGCQLTHTRYDPAQPVDDHAVSAMNRLRDETNCLYGYRDGIPRVNLGPCGRFAKLFRRLWNEKFNDKVTIVFVMSADSSICHHVLIKLPDGRYFDGGNGVISGKALSLIYPESHIDEMPAFDLALLDKRSYGLNRDYPSCPNYSDAETAGIISRCLASINEARRQ